MTRRRSQAQRAADPNLDHENPIEELFEDQLNCADMVIVNKTDLLDAGEHAAVTAELRRQGARRHEARAPPATARSTSPPCSGVGASAEDDLANRLSHHEMEGEEQHDHDDFVTFIVSLGEVADKARLAEAHRADHRQPMTSCASRASPTSRARPPRLLVQAVGPRLNSYFDRPWKAGERARHAARGDRREAHGPRGDRRHAAGLMHLLATTSGVIDGGAEAVDLGQSPADIIVLSAADSELACLARAHDAGTRARCGSPTSCSCSTRSRSISTSRRRWPRPS